MTEENKNESEHDVDLVDVNERVETPDAVPVELGEDGLPNITYTVARDTVVGSRKKLSAAATAWHRPASIYRVIWEVKRITGLGIKVAILDTGVAQHEIMKNPIVRKSYRNGATAVEDYPLNWVENMHGTHVASIVAGQNGIGGAPGVEIMDYQVLFGKEGSGGNDGISQAIIDATDDGADIINMSLGSDGNYPADQRVVKAVAYAISKGVYVFAAAGNSGFVAGRNSVDNPGKLSGTIGVAAIRSDGSIAGFSGGGEEVDIAAPGENILGADFRGGLVSISGTSMATPDAVATFALVLERADRSGLPRPQTLAEVRESFAKYTKDGGAPGEDVRFGSGVPRVDVMAEAMASPDVNILSDAQPTGI